MSMFKIDELAGVMIKQGRFKDAIPKIGHELNMAITYKVISSDEYFGRNGVMQRLCEIMLNPNDLDKVTKLGDDLIYIAIRIPGYVKKA